MRKARNVISLLLTASMLCMTAACSSGNAEETVGTSTEGEITSTSDQATVTTTTEATTTSATEASTTTTIQTTSSSENTSDVTAETSETKSAYEENDYYSLVETGSFKTYYNQVVHKVKAKTTCRVEVTALAYDSNGDIIDKTSDDVVLVKGQYSCFHFTFSDLSDKEFKNAVIEYSAVLKRDLTDTLLAVDYEISASLGNKNIFEVDLVKYNSKKNSLYLTFEYTRGDMGIFDQFRIIFYKGDKIVGYEDGYFNVYADGLKNVGDKDVAEIRIPSSAKKYDRIEYIYAPSEF